MALTLNEAPKAQRRSKYPVEDWLKNPVLVLIKGTEAQVQAGDADFAQSSTSMRSMLYTRSKDHGKKITSRTFKGDAAAEVVKNAGGKPPSDTKDYEILVVEVEAEATDGSKGRKANTQS